MSLDRQTVIIIPKRCIQKGTIDAFLQFLASKIYPSRFKIKGVKSTYVTPSVPEETTSVNDETKNQETDSKEQRNIDRNIYIFFASFCISANDEGTMYT